MREALRMLVAKIRGMPFGAPSADAVKEDVTARLSNTRRHQKAIAFELSRKTGVPPRQLLDYRRADHLLRR